jgi:hypothetical protein
VWFQDGRLILEKKGKKGAMVEEPAPVSEPEKKDKYDPWYFKFGGATKDKM